MRYNKVVLVTPSILTSSGQDVVYQINRLLPYYRHFQIDIADGKFVPGKTAVLDEIIKYLENSPLPPDVRLDFHLMVIDQSTHIHRIAESALWSKVDIVLVHIGLKPDYSQLVKVGKNLSIGLVFNPEDDVQFFSSYYDLKMLPGIQIMSVIPGRQGNVFIPNTLHKIEQLRLLDYRNKVYLDGGINEKTLPIIMRQNYKPDVIGPGSYLSQAPDIEARVKELDRLISARSA